MAKTNNNKYYNWDDSFKLFLAEGEGKKFKIKIINRQFLSGVLGLQYK